VPTGIDRPFLVLDFAICVLHVLYYYKLRLFLIACFLFSLFFPIGNSPAIQENRVTTVQCLSGTGSLRVGAEFLAKHHHQVKLFLI
jgi:hypothetical protein